MIPAEKTTFGRKWGNWQARRTLRHHFERIYISGTLDKWRTEQPTIMVLNHSGWFDTELSLWLTEQLLGLDYYMMAYAETMTRHPFMRRYGCFSIDESDPFKVTEGLRYAGDLIAGQRNRCLVMFPQGWFQRSVLRPLKFQHGTAQIARRIKHVSLLPIAVHYDFFLQKRPEIYLRVGQTLLFDGNVPATRVLTQQLEEVVSAELDQLQDDIYNLRPDPFRIALEGTQPIFTQIRQRIRASEQPPVPTLALGDLNR